MCIRDRFLARREDDSAPAAPRTETATKARGVPTADSVHRASTRDGLRIPGIPGSRDGDGEPAPKSRTRGSDDATLERWTGATGAEWAQWFLPGIPPGTPATPLCLVCGDAYDASRRETLGHPFCGEPCAKAFRVKTRAGFARAELFKLERGVCQSCGLDCDALLARLLAEPSVPERVRALESARGPRAEEKGGALCFSSARAAAIARAPRAGDLWQADHIVPVAEGGGECGLENFRTLCDGCHRRETSDLRARMRLAAAAAAAEGTKDIRGFFGANAS